MSLMTNLLAVLGVILIIVVIVYVWRKYNDTGDTPVTTPAFPPADYMETVGTKCPDLWKLQKVNSNGSYHCVNSENIPIVGKYVVDEVTKDEHNKRWCDNQAKKFSKMDKWPLDDATRDADLKSRCTWIERCGVSNNVPAAWTGIDNLC